MKGSICTSIKHFQEVRVKPWVPVKGNVSDDRFEDYSANFTLSLPYNKIENKNRKIK